MTMVEGRFDGKKRAFMRNYHVTADAAHRDAARLPNVTTCVMEHDVPEVLQDLVDLLNRHSRGVQSRALDELYPGKELT